MDSNKVKQCVQNLVDLTQKGKEPDIGLIRQNVGELANEYGVEATKAEEPKKKKTAKKKKSE